MSFEWQRSSTSAPREEGKTFLIVAYATNNLINTRTLANALAQGHLAPER
jgi:hypothetical protein